MTSDVPIRDTTDDLQPLLASIMRGDRAAFKMLYEKTSGRLFGTVKRIVGNHASAEEVLQDVYLRVWQKAASYNENTGPVLPWLTMIARNRAIDVVRQSSERLATRKHDDGDELLLHLAAPSNGLELADRNELKRCLALLEDKQCRCILLAYCVGYSREELAVRFNRPVNSVKTWLHRGLASLRTCLEADE